MEQLAARRAHNPKVTGSSPVPATNTEAVDSIEKLISGFFISILLQM
jgi:hypothetical protein